VTESQRIAARLWSSGFILGVLVGFLLSGFFW
jgi:hypothetical protein